MLTETTHLDIDDDAVATIPINKLRADARAARAARDAIDDFLSTEYTAAYEAAHLACARAVAEMERLAGNKKTRYGSWRTPADVELMARGLL